MELPHIGILGAMPEEIGEITNQIENKKETFYGDLKIIQGIWINKIKKNKIRLTIAWSGWGKVSSARAATRIISSCFGNKIDLLLFTGVAGAVSDSLNQWDLIIPSSLFQYDMDARPFFERFVIPALDKDNISIDDKLINWSKNTLIKALSDEPKLNNFGSLKIGKIATGDKFISDKKYLSDLKNQIPGLLAIEMEGAAVAQVAFQEKVPCLIIRTISDSADEDAPSSFDIFLEEYKLKSWFIIESLLNNFSSMTKSLKQ